MVTAASPGTGNKAVLRLITRLNVGGPARHALLLTRHLNAEFPTTLAAGRPAASEGEVADPQVPVVDVPLVRPVSPRLDVAAVRAARELISGRGARIVHTHMAKAGAVGRIAARTVPRRPRTVHTFHGHVLDGYFSPRVERTFLETERWLARSTDALVAVSPEIRDGLLDLRIGRPSQYHVIPLGLDLDGFLSAGGPTGALRAELGLAGEPLVGVVGRLVPIKDHRTLFTAMEMLPGAHLAVIGDGELRPELEKDVVDRGLAGRVHFTGWRTDLPQAVSDLDVVVLTSRNEGTPVALIEALAARRAVVATAVGGVGAVVQDEKTGLLAPAGDAAQIAARISRLLESADLRRRLSAAGHDHVVQRFGARRLIEDIRGLYSDLLAAPGS